MIGINNSANLVIAGTMIKLYPMLTIFFISIIILLLDLFRRGIYKLLLKKFENSKLSFETYILLLSFNKPVKYLILFNGFTYLIEKCNYFFKVYFNYQIDFGFSTLRHIITTIIIVFGARSFIGIFKDQFIQKITKFKNQKKYYYDKTTVDAVSKLIMIFVYFIGIVTILSESGISLTGLLAFSGGATIVAGFAAKDILANIFGGVMIYMDRPFSVDDWVKSTNGEIEGFVEKIGWRLTTIRTFDKRPVYVPNYLFSTLSIQNPSRMTNRRIRQEFGVNFEDHNKIKNFIDDIELMLHTHQDLDQNMTTFVKIVGFTKSYIEILLYAFTKTIEFKKFYEVREDVLFKVLDICEQNNIQIAFDTYKVMLNNNEQNIK